MDVTAVVNGEQLPTANMFSQTVTDEAMMRMPSDVDALREHAALAAVNDLSQGSRCNLFLTLLMQPLCRLCRSA